MISLEEYLAAPQKVASQATLYAPITQTIVVPKVITAVETVAALNPVAFVAALGHAQRVGSVVLTRKLALHLTANAVTGASIALLGFSVVVGKDRKFVVLRPVVLGR